MNQEKTLTFNLSGHELTNEKYNLHLLIEGLLLSQRLLEQSYLITRNKYKMTKTERENFKIYINDIREGSFESDIIIIMQTISGSLLSGFSGANPKEIWLLVSNSVKYLIYLFTANSKGEKVEVNVINSPNAVVNVKSDNNITQINTNQDVINCANKIEPIIRKSLNMIDEKQGVTSFNLIDKHKKENGIMLGINEKKLFKNEPILDDKIIEFEGEITSANFNNMTGKIRVKNPKNSGLIKDDYNFSFIEETDEDLFRESCSKILTIKAIKKLIFNTVTFQRDVDSLKILKFI